MGGTTAPLAAVVYSATDEPVAQQLAGMLSASLGYRVDTDCGGLEPGENFIDRMGTATWHADLTVVLLRPESVPRVWVAEEWQEVLWGGAAGVLVCGLQTAAARVPARGRGPGYCYLDGQKDMPAALAALRRWVIETRSVDQERSFDPAPVAGTGRAVELQEAAALLVEQAGVLVVTGDGGCGKTHFAHEFARAHQKDFDDILWVSCRHRRIEEIEREVHQWECRQRGLLVLDDCDWWRGLERGPLVSCLVTTGRERRGFPSLHLSASDQIVELDEELGNLLSVCRSEWMLPSLCNALGLDKSALVPLDLNTGVLRAPGWVHHLSPEPVWRQELELRHAEAVLRVLSEGGGPEVLVDARMALYRMAGVEAQKPLFALIARRAEQLCRACGDSTMREQVLGIAAEAAWNHRDEVLLGRFAPDLAMLLEEMGRVEEADAWRRRREEAETRQMWLPFENSQNIFGAG